MIKSFSLVRKKEELIYDFFEDIICDSCRILFQLLPVVNVAIIDVMNRLNANSKYQRG